MVITYNIFPFHCWITHACFPGSESGKCVSLVAASFVNHLIRSTWGHWQQEDMTSLDHPTSGTSMLLAQDGVTPPLPTYWWVLQSRPCKSAPRWWCKLKGHGQRRQAVAAHSQLKIKIWDLIYRKIEHEIWLEVEVKALKCLKKKTHQFSKGGHSLYPETPVLMITYLIT